MRMIALAAAACLLTAPAARAADLEATMRQATPEGPGAELGTVTFAAGPDGVVVTPHLHGLPPGDHGFHVHAVGSCDPKPGPDGKAEPAGAAGGHWDPTGSGRHAGPEGAGHEGDLPVLTVNADGTATTPLSAPHIEDVAALRGKALMIHGGGENYSDQPEPLGGGGPRIACGIIE